VPTFIARLELLQVLLINNNRLVSLPEEIGRLSQLSHLVRAPFFLSLLSAPTNRVCLYTHGDTDVAVTFREDFVPYLCSVSVPVDFCRRLFGKNAEKCSSP